MFSARCHVCSHTRNAHTSTLSSPKRKTWVTGVCFGLFAISFDQTQRTHEGRWGLHHAVASVVIRALDPIGLHELQTCIHLVIGYWAKIQNVDHFMVPLLCYVCGDREGNFSVDFIVSHLHPFLVLDVCLAQCGRFLFSIFRPMLFCFNELFSYMFFEC